MTSRRACRSSPLNFSKVLAAFAVFIVCIDFVKGYKGCSCQSVHTERWYDGCEVYTTKQKWLAGLACNFFQVCDNGAMNTLNVEASPISPYTFLYIVCVTFQV